MRLERVGFSDLPGWAEDDHGAALRAFARSAIRDDAKPYRTGSLGIDPATFSFDQAMLENAGADPRGFFETMFQPVLIQPGGGGRGFVTSYYEPVVEASADRTERFRYPLYRRPDDLVAIDDRNRPAGLDRYMAFGRTVGGEIHEYHDRAAIEAGALAGRGIELAWLEDPVDAFFIHVQGAARLHMTDGRERRITYAAKSGQRFTGPGSILVATGEIAADAISMQSIRAWFKRHPERIDEILWQNRSFIFFRDAPVDDPASGPVAAAKVPLTAGRSVAVDRLIHTFGTPFFIHAPELTRFENRPFRRLMIAQDTGSAITGPARGDLFAGSGDAAGEVAGAVRHEADFFMLAPRIFADRLP